MLYKRRIKPQPDSSGTQYLIACPDVGGYSEPMVRLARLVVPDVAHHVTQRGNRRQPVFFSDEDYAAYRDLVAGACVARGVRCLAWCLMPNHLHLILTPADPDGLRAALAEAHRRYSRRINLAHDWTGYLFQGRFASYPMDDAHLMAAVRYVELNPVRAKLVGRAENWPWSSARAHVTGRADGLTNLDALAGIFSNWRAMLRHGLEAGDLEDEEIAAIEAHARTGRPRGNEAFVAALEARTGRGLKRRKPGPKPKHPNAS
jgi:putative transposase